jgi:thiol-disulfide isomerase/thioredoxin
MRALAILTVLALAACGSAPPRASAPSPLLGQSVSLALPTDTGGLFTLPREDHRPLVLDFFGPTCAACRAKVPAMLAKKAAIEAKGARFALVGVLGDAESTDDARRALASWGVRAAFVVDRASVSRRELGVEVLPATVVLDGGGAVRWVAPPDAAPEDVVAAVP